MEKGFKNETVQHMIDILGTHSNYEAELEQLVEANKDGSCSNQPNTWSKFMGCPTSKGRSIKISNMMLNGYKPAQKDDTTFLTEICTVTVEDPVYQQITEEILQEAANSLGIKLKKLEKELLQLVKREISCIAVQEIAELINAEKQAACQAGCGTMEPCLQSGRNPRVKQQNTGTSDLSNQAAAASMVSYLWMTICVQDVYYL